MTPLYETDTTGAVGWRLFQLGTGDAATFHPLTAEADTLEVLLRLGEMPDSFGTLYAQLENDIAQKPDGYVLGVTSAVGGEGVSTVALHLARAAASKTFKRVGLLEMSLGEPVLAGRVGAETSPLTGAGAVSLIENADPTVPVLRLASDSDISLLPAGRLPQNPSRSARSPRVRDIIAAARDRFDLVILDLPAVVSDNAHPLCVYADGLAFVVRAGITPRTTVARAIERVGRHRVRGMVLNDTYSPVPPGLKKRLLAEA
ncbi:MAG: hypothetical protein H7Y38_13515 [Armatimonadetes bacterium]|nr:hypothetical protein [Armatimonadota bacterium]